MSDHYHRGFIEFQREFFSLAGVWLKCRWYQADPDNRFPDSGFDPVGTILGELDNLTEMKLMVDEWHRSRWMRASGECVCGVCRRPYYDHPMDRRELSYDGTPYLSVLCGGRRVKL